MLSSISLPSELQSRHRWFLRMQPGIAEASIEAFTALFRNFATLGDAGAFVARASDGRNCTMRIVHEDRSGSDAIVFLVDIADCDPRYARPLRNAVFACGQILENPVAEFRVESAGQPAGLKMEALVNPDEVIGGSFYPECSTRLGVRLQSNVPPNYRSGRRMWLIGHNALSLELVRDLVQLVDLWGAVLVSAYPGSEEELRNGTSIILNVEGSQHDELTFEVLVDRFIASESAFSSLLNLLVTRINSENVVSKTFLE